MPARSYRLAIYVVFCLLLLSSVVMSAQTLNFTRMQGPATRFTAHADLNNDGREDFIDHGDTGTFRVILSTGDGTYAAPVVYTAPVGSPSYFAVGDFNGDGWADIVYTTSGSSSFFEWLNNGDGTFRYAAEFTTDSSQGLQGLTAGDFNHDGKIDLAIAYDATHVRVYFGDGHAFFSPGPTSTAVATGFMEVGDFNGDGKADVLTFSKDYNSSASILYGDGTGSFPTRFDIFDEPGWSVADVNGDGISDLIGQPFSFSLHGSTYHNTVRVWYGNSSNTMTSSNIPLGRCGGTNGPAVADFNGDGLPDIAVQEVSDCSTGAGPYYLSILLRNADGTYQPEQDISSSSFVPAGITAVRANLDTKPDIAMYELDSPNAGNANIVAFVNNTAGNFTTCSPPNSFTGIHICAPASPDVSGSTHFAIAAAGQTPMRKIEVWVDGNKAGEQLYGFSRYAFLEKDIAVSSGTHNIEVYAAGWDNLLQHTTLTAGGGGGGSCPQPSSPGVNICSPANGSTVTSPVTISAAGRNTGATAGLDVWLDGAKVGWYPGTSVNIQPAVSAGSHQLDIYSVGTDGELKLATSVFTVSSTGGGGNAFPCPQTTPGVHICTPFEGGSFSSPVRVVAAGKNTSAPTAGLDVWMDGTKVGWYPTNYIDISVPASAGSHEIDIYAVGTDGEALKSVVTFYVDAGTGGGGGSCPEPASAGVNVCAPTQGSTVNTPVRIWATGKNDGFATRGLDVWIDGQKVGFYDSPTIDITVDLALGSHTLEIFAIPFTSGGYSTPPKATVTFTVGGTSTGGGGAYTGPCVAPSDPNLLNLCSPVSGSTLSSPVRVAVHGGSNVDTIEMWLDGNKTGITTGAGGQSIDGPYAMSPGTHRLDIYGKVNGAVTDHKFTVFTVQ